jgi:hypothetical protein
MSPIKFFPWKIFIKQLPTGAEGITCTHLAALQPAVEPYHPLL